MYLPNEFKDRMKNMLGSEYDEFISSYSVAAPSTGIRINTNKKNALEAVCAALPLGDPVAWCREGFYADKSEISGNHPYHAAGLFYFQEPSAMAAAEALPVEEGDYILDLCAAPGGKATQTAAKLHGTGLLAANEITYKRAQVLSQNVERLGFSNIIVTSEAPQKLEERFAGFFDKITVDAPCSGEGMFRKEPQAVTEWSIEHTLSCGMRQKNILDSAVKMLRGGGYLLYSTCTFAPAENEAISEYLLTEYPFLELCEIPELGMLSDGVSEWGGGTHDLTASKRIFPHKQRGEGHYIALFRHTGEKTPRPIMKGYPAPAEAVSSYREFEKAALNTRLDGCFTAFGDRLYLMPAGIDTNNLKILRAGLELGVCKKGRFEPSHALCLALTQNDFLNTVNLDLSSPELKSYYAGDVIGCSASGWCAVTVNGYPAGWGKASGGILKNHYPKALRIR